VKYAKYAALNNCLLSLLSSVFDKGGRNEYDSCRGVHSAGIYLRLDDRGVDLVRLFDYVD
jgi:hypothetical protein